MPNHVTNQINFYGKSEDIEIVMKMIRNLDDDKCAIDFNHLIPMPDELDIVDASDLYRAMNVYLTLINPNSMVKTEGLEKFSINAFDETMKRVREKSPISSNAMLKIEEIKQIVEDITDNDNIDEVISRGKIGISNIIKYGAVSWYDWRRNHWGTIWNAYNQNVKSGTSISFNTAWSMPEPILQKLAELCYDHDMWFEGQFVSEDWSSCSGWFKSDNNKLIVYYDKTEEEAAKRAQEIWGYDPREYDDDMIHEKMIMTMMMNKHEELHSIDDTSNRYS